MADIFISYDREDKPRIRSFVRKLEKLGFSVFWDPHIPAGQDFADYISQALKDAGCVIVVWSERSIISDWVKDEAGEGKDRGSLVPILLDSVKPPIGFRSIQAADLTGSQTSRSSKQFDKLVNDIESLLRTTRGQLPAKRVAELKRETSRQSQNPSLKRRQPAKPALRQMVQIGEVRFPQVDPKAHQFYDGKHTGRREISVPVKFDFPFTGQPRVTVSLQKIDLGDLRANIHRIAVRAENVRLSGFDLYFETWLDSQIYDAIASWTAVGQ